MKNAHLFETMKQCSGLLVAVLVAGCSSPKDYFADADKEVYAILDQRHRELFGGEKSFTVETPYSKRKPEDILHKEIQDNRGADGTVTNKLTLSRALEMAVGNSRDYQLQRETLFLSALALTDERHNFVFKFTKANLDLSRNRSSDNVNTTKSDASFTLRKVLKTGGEITADLVNDLTLYFNGGGPQVPDFALDLAQPLLKGAGAKFAEELLKQSERDLVYAIRSFTRYQKTFLVDRITEYLQLLQNKNEVRVAWDLYQDRIRFRQEQELRLQGELISQFQLDQALRNEYSAKVAYRKAVESYWDLLDDFKKQLNLPLGEPVVLDDNELVILEQFGLRSISMDDKIGFTLAVDHRLDVLNHIDKYEDKKRKVEVAANDLLPSLSLVANYSLKEQYYNRNSFDFGDYEAKAGLSLDLPLDRLTERNVYRKSRILFEQQLRSLMQTFDDLRDQIRTNLRKLDQNQQDYIINQKSLAVARRELEKAKLDMQAGLDVAPRDILEAQTAVSKARNNVSGAFINFHIQRLRLLNNLGVLNTGAGQFWVQPQPVPGAAPVVPGALQEIPALPPEQILGN